MGHWGELLPYYLDRIDEMLPQEKTKLDQKISAYFKSNIYITPSGLFDKLPAQLCIEALGADRIIWSTDYPYIMKKNTKDFLSGLEISEDDKNKIAHLNAENLFKL